MRESWLLIHRLCEGAQKHTLLETPLHMELARAPVSRDRLSETPLSGGRPGHLLLT
jgi:hypothetical protein